MVVLHANNNNLCSQTATTMRTINRTNNKLSCRTALIQWSWVLGHTHHGPTRGDSTDTTERNVQRITKHSTRFTMGIISCYIPVLGLPEW